MKSIPSLSSIINQYEALILDLWGVVHDGTHLYPGVIEVLQQLKAANKKVMFLSNAPRRASKVVAVLQNLGVDDSLYLEAMSSGEMGYCFLKENQEARAAGQASLACPPKPKGRRGKRTSCKNQQIFAEAKTYYYLGPDKDADVLDGLDYVRVDDIKNADLLLNVGFGSEAQATDDWMPLLRGAKGVGLPMVCLNPDLVVVKQSGERFACAGELAGRYEQLGGQVTWFGKPYPEVYNHCFAALGVAKEKILAIGDSLHTDIKGAQEAGIDSVLVTGGILKDQAHRIEALCAEQATHPTYVMPELVWQVAGDKIA